MSMGIVSVCLMRIAIGRRLEVQVRGHAFVTGREYIEAPGPVGVYLRMPDSLSCLSSSEARQLSAALTAALVALPDAERSEAEANAKEAEYRGQLTWPSSSTGEER